MHDLNTKHYFRIVLVNKQSSLYGLVIMRFSVNVRSRFKIGLFERSKQYDNLVAIIVSTAPLRCEKFCNPSSRRLYVL